MSLADESSTDLLWWTPCNSPSWQSNIRSACQEIIRLIWNPKVHYHVHKGTPLVPVLSQMNPVHILSIYFFKIRSNIIRPSKPRSSEWSLSHVSHAFYMLRRINPSLFDHPTNISWSAQVVKLLIMQSSPVTHHFFPLNCKYSPQHHVLGHPQTLLLP